MLADYHSALKTQNHHSLITTVISLANHGKDLWKSPWGTMTRIEALVLLTTAFLLYLSMLGSWRRQSKNFFIQKGVFLTYTLSSSLISYTFGSMQSSAVKSSMYPIWAVSLYLLNTSVESTAYSLTDHNQSTKLVISSILDLIYALLISISISSFVSFLLGSAMVNLGMLRFAHRVWASRMATASWNMSKMVSDYMEEEHKHGQAYDPCKLDGYRYLVDWPFQDIKLEDGISYGTAALAKNATQVVDVEKVWKKLNNINGRSLSSNKFDMELKDTCLSFSLFHLLRRRCFGYACSESSKQKTHDFVFKGLLLDHNGSIDHSRVFKVIEVELAFMYDFFFTKYAYLYYVSGAALYWSLVTASLMFVTAYLTATSATIITTTLDVSFLDSNSTVMIDMVITILILACIAVLELLQQLLFWTSIWGRVSLVCQYVREEASSRRGCGLCVKLKEIVAWIGVHAWNRHYWQDTLDQYSLLESVCYNGSPVVCNPIPVKVQNCFRKCVRAAWSSLYLVALGAYYPVGHRRGGIKRKPGKSIKLPAKVKDALVQCLHRTQGVLTNGELALVSNGAYHLSWALRLHKKSVSLKTENQTIIILTWHIATCYCEMAPSSADLSSGDFVAATKLSKYCAYLVVCAPKLLPGHHFDTAIVFDEFAAEASDFLGDAKGESEKYNHMASSHEGEGKFFHNGVKLGKELEHMGEWKRWKVLADFWSEMLLYLAPSDNVTEHIECLAKGGEFITHLWALLTHAGILDRGQIDIENAPTFRRANSYPMTCADKWATTQGNNVHSERKVQKGENNEVQNMERTPNAGTAPSEVEEIE